MAAMGVSDPDQVGPDQLRMVVKPGRTVSYAEYYDWLQPGQLLDGAPEDWVDDWELARTDTFRAPVTSTKGDER